MVKSPFRLVLRPDPRGVWIESEETRIAFREAGRLALELSVPADAFAAMFAQHLEFAKTDLDSIATAIQGLLAKVKVEGYDYSIDPGQDSHGYSYCETPEGEVCYHEYPLRLGADRIGIQSTGSVTGYIAFLCEYKVAEQSDN